MKKSILKVTNIKKQYKNQTALENINFELYEGEICAVIGKNGAGKSTLFKVISNEAFPTEGDITLFGETYGKHNSRHRMGTMIETNVFFDKLNAVQNLEYYRLQRGIPDKDVIHKVILEVGLEKQIKKKFREYSLGMKQRLAIALALMGSPDFLLLDEPINGMDPEGIANMRKFFLKLNQEHKITILISSHILSELQSIATRFVFLNDGKIIKDLSKDEFLKLSHEYISIYTNDSGKTCVVLENFFRDIDYKVFKDKHIEIYNHIEERQNINRILNEKDIDILEMAVKSENLEEYFLNLVGGDSDD